MTSSLKELRIVLIGKTGHGKSSTGNSLLHSSTAFCALESGSSITRKCEVGKVSYTDNNAQLRALTVVDTPGFFDTDPNYTNDVIKKQIASQIFEMTTPGVHAFLIVVSSTIRFSPEEKATIDFIRNIFGDKAAQYCIVVLTGVDRLQQKSPEEFVNTAPALKEFIQICGNRLFAMNNTLVGESLKTKTKELIKMIDDMVKTNNGTYYTNAIYIEIERQKEEDEQNRKEEERRKKKAEEDALVARIREEERKKAEERERRIREEERQRAEQRNGPGTSFDFMRYLTSAFGATSINDYAYMPHSTSRPVSASPYGGRLTGEYMSTTGAANGRAIYEGPKGGRYHITESGNRSYIRK
ncbi:unnamed protein product [Rotaria sordida]|uniref:AIG1-type G domain-containing protein n=1 Tax=Rotaria sordida TaxID=392033 RepID=A0A815QR57_9BILA|nr:unnamed protein product [Rotaria sordida]CAF1491345.1 unnamed protein product [Rotaria sordida]CAF1643744.1 unnamed protein product [Rotaria sordida]